MLQYMREKSNYLERANQISHFLTLIRTVNKERTITLLVYHNFISGSIIVAIGRCAHHITRTLDGRERL